MKRKKIKTILLTLSLSVLSLVSITTLVKADDPTAGVGYQVEPIFTKEQIDPDKGFYYLKTVPGTEQIIEAEIISSQEEPVDVKLSVLDSYTQDNGQMGYTDLKDKLDKTLEQPLSSLVTVEPAVVTVKNFEKKVVQFKLKVPSESYQGVKAGALLFSREDKDKKGISSKNEFRIGLLTSESGDSYSDSLSLNLLDAKGTIKDAKKVVSLIFQNPEPKILANLMLDVSIKEKKSGKVLKTKQVTDYVMAPNSKFEFDLDWGIEKIPAGDFIATVNAQNGEKTWDLTKEFTISGKEAKKFNALSPYQIITPLWVKISTVILGVLVTLASILIFARRKKREKRLKKARRGKNKKRRK